MVNNGVDVIERRDHRRTGERAEVMKATDGSRKQKGKPTVVQQEDASGCCVEQHPIAIAESWIHDELDADDDDAAC
jgi:hypothetical protein